MIIAPIIVFLFTIIATLLLYNILGNRFALDEPSARKHHKELIPRIGGLVFGSGLLLISFLLNLTPIWYLIGGLISIIIGAIDDFRHIPWQIKLFFQLLLCFYLASIFWGSFDEIIFYNFTIHVDQILLFVIFLFWFIGIFNAVNLLDGLDGLSGGFIFIISVGLSLVGDGPFSQLNAIFAIILLGFLIYNQRPAKLFMGDSGSLFLGYHVAVLPLLYYSISGSSSSSLFVTPFVILSSFLIADTTRVFFTRITSKKNPMNADTIHFHHLVLQQSTSYLTAIGTIYVITIFTVIMSILSFSYMLNSDIMLWHITFLLVFVLTPPVQTYVPFISKIIKPLYKWNKTSIDNNPFFIRTLLIMILLICFFISLVYMNDNLFETINWYHGIALLILFLFSFKTKKELISRYIIQTSICLIYIQVIPNIEYYIVNKLFIILLGISYIIFLLERRIGCKIRNYSSLDLICIVLCFGGGLMSLLGFNNLSWISLSLFALWFNLSFILQRTIYYNNEM